MNPFRKLIGLARTSRFYSKKLAQVQTINLPLKQHKTPVHIFTIAYNNAVLLEHQERLIRKNITDDYVFIVADNSPDPQKRKQIAEACCTKHIGYIGLPSNPYTSSSNSHGACLNWLWKNYLPVYQPEIIGFIDHDIYPVKPVSIAAYLKDQPVYGHLQGQAPHWYLWAGLCFFKYAALPSTQLNFLPAIVGSKQMDTGGANWEPLYSHIDIKSLTFPSHEYMSLREGTVVQSDKMEQIGEWLHSFNGSYWMKVAPKENLLEEYLDKL